MSRITSIRENIKGTEDADDLMLEIIGVLEEGEKVPEPGEFYVFVYNPKTPNIRYDQNPLVAVTAVYEWGFKGINFHWGENRQYTWSEIAGGLYKVESDELNDLDQIPFAKFRLNS
jgi:hypothetical protein